MAEEKKDKVEKKETSDKKVTTKVDEKTSDTKKHTTDKKSVEKSDEKKIDSKSDDTNSKEKKDASKKKSAAQKAQEAAKAAKSGETKKKKTGTKKDTSKKAKDKKGADKKDASKPKLTKEEKKAARKAKKAEKKAARKAKKQPELKEVNLSKKELRNKRREENKKKKMDPRKKKILQRSIWAVCLVVLVGFGVSFCFQMAGKLLPNAGLACRVDSAETKEADVTNYIEHNTYYSYYKKDPSKWGQFLSQYGMTPATFRNQVIEDKFVHDDLVERACSDKEGIEVTDEDIDNHVKALRDKYNSDSAYQKGLSDMGYTEDSYRESVRVSSLEKSLKEKVAPETEPSDADMVSYMNTNKSTYNGAKRSSHILLGLGDKQKAQEILDQLKAGTITWEQAVQNSTDTSSKEKNGDVGWDKCNSFVSAYTTALSSLDKGAMSQDLVQSDYGYHIIKVTDKWDAPDTITDISQVPTDIVTYAKDKKKSSDQDTTFSTYLDNLKSELGIVVEIYDMPDYVPYNIDMNKYGSSSNGVSTSGGTTTTSSDGTTTTTTGQ